MRYTEDVMFNNFPRVFVTIDQLRKIRVLQGLLHKLLCLIINHWSLSLNHHNSLNKHYTVVHEENYAGESLAAIKKHRLEVYCIQGSFR